MARTYLPLIAALAGCLSILTGNLRADDGLSTFRNEVRQPDAPDESAEEKHPSHGHPPDCHCSTCDDEFGMAFGKLMFWIVSSPFWGPPAVVADDYAQTGYFAEYPYQHDTPGFMKIEPCVSGDAYCWSSRASVEYGTNFGGLERIGSRLVLDTSSRLGVDAEFNYWTEELAGGGQDELYNGDANFIYRFAQSEQMMMRTGVGMNWLAHSAGSDFGVNFTYGGDFFPCRPWIVSADIDLGTLGSATLFHGRATTGVQLNRLEAYIGYDYYDVGNAQLDGFVSGLRVWY